MFYLLKNIRTEPSIATSLRPLVRKLGRMQKRHPPPSLPAGRGLTDQRCPICLAPYWLFDAFLATKCSPGCSKLSRQFGCPMLIGIILAGRYPPDYSSSPFWLLGTFMVTPDPLPLNTRYPLGCWPIPGHSTPFWLVGSRHISELSVPFY